MLKHDYQRLFDAISPDPLLEQRTEREILNMLQPKFKRSLRRTLCIAVIATVLVLGVTFAAINSSGILDRLFTGAQPNSSASEAVVRNAVQVSQNGLTLNLDEYLLDRSSLHLGWTVSSERDQPIFYTSSYQLAYTNPDDLTLAENSVGGQFGAYSSEEVGDGQMVCLNDAQTAYSGYAGESYASAIASPVNATITVHAYETDYEAVSLPQDLRALDLTDAANDETISALEGAKQLGVCDSLTNVQGYQAFASALSRLSDSGMPWEEANEAALVESGIFREVAVLELEVTLDPASAAQSRYALDAERSIALSDATLILKTFSVDAASTHVEYEIITDKLLDEDNIVGNGVTYILFDQNGHPLNADYELSMSCGQLNDQNGAHVYRVTLDGHPLSEDVTAITFAPTAPLERMEGESTNAYFQRMLQASEESQRFTLPLE